MSYPKNAVAAALMCLMGGCDGGTADDHDHDHDHDHDTDATSTLDVTLTFDAMVAGAPFACGTTYDNLGTSDASSTFLDFRFYVSNVRLLSGAEEVPVTLATDGKWQLQDGADHVALLDFEDGSADCSGTGNIDLNSTVVGTVPAGTYDGVVFDIGVPFAMNHLDVTVAEPPLNIGALYWAWASGHKFMRVDFDVDGTPWNLHLGSTMCTSDGMEQAPEIECSRPNRSTIRIEGFDVATDVVTFDAAALVEASDIATNLGEPTPGCMSFPHDEADCTGVFTGLGLDYASGACVRGCEDQVAFIAE